MKRLLSRTPALAVLIAALVALGACNKKQDVQVSQGPSGGGAPGMGGGGRGGPRSPVGEIMMKIGGRTPQALAPAIGEALKADAPEWDKIATQSKELAEMIQSMAKYDPPKGSKESWSKHTSEFAAAASALEKAAGTKDKDGALSAHKTLSDSCNACHQAHRGGPMGAFGPMGGKGFGPPGKDGGFGPPPGKGGDAPPPKE